MHRKDFISSLSALALSNLFSIRTNTNSGPNGEGKSNRPLTLPQKKQVNWQAAELGMIFHYDISIFGDRNKGNNGYKGGYDPKIWDPCCLDTDQWIRIAKECGCRYAVLTATHFQGFLNWSSDLYPFGMKQASWKDGNGDLVGEFVNSCRKYGIQPCLYMSTHRNFYQEVDDFRVNWGKGGAEQAAYNDLCEKMVEELSSRYGKLFELWFDAGNLIPQEGGPDLLPIINRYQPEAIYYKSNQRRDHRWCGKSNQGLVGDPCWSRTFGPDYSEITNTTKLETMLFHGVKNGTYWSPAFSGIPICEQWFWNPGSEFMNSHKSVERLAKSYYKTVGRNANLVLGATPDRRGLIPEWQEKLMKNFGQKIKQLYENPIQELSGSRRKFIFVFKIPAKLNYVIIQEEITHGERIRSWELKGVSNDTLRHLANGQSIGNKRIVFFKTGAFKKIIFNVVKAVRTPVIKSLTTGLNSS